MGGGGGVHWAGPPEQEDGLIFTTVKSTDQKNSLICSTILNRESPFCKQHHDGLGWAFLPIGSVGHDCSHNGAKEEEQGESWYQGA